MARARARAASPDLLPEPWRAAYERDRRGEAVYADPLPERRAARLLAAFILTGLFFLALPGTFMGVWNLIEIAAHQAASGASTAWIQAHGQAQVFGWVGSFILGISLYILPKLRGSRLRSPALGWLIWALWTLGVGWRWGCGVGLRSWRWGLIGAAALEIGAFILSQYLLVFAPPSAAKRRPRDLGSRLGIAGFAGLGAALIVNLVAAIAAVRLGVGPLYPVRLDRRVVELALWSFVLPLAWAYSTRFVTIFLGLEPPRHETGIALQVGLSVFLVLTLAGLFSFADVLALALAMLAVWALRIFRPSAKHPKTQGVYRAYPMFVRLAFGWLLGGALLGVAADAWPRFTGLAGAGRHALTVGFVATLIFSIGPRILPAFLNSRQLFSSRLMAMSLWLLTLGCGLRVASESVAYGASGGWAWRALPVSAFLELAAVLIFVVNMGWTLAQAPPAWFQPESITADSPLYWYLASYRATRRVLADAGLVLVGKIRNVPRSLTLAEAAAAEGVAPERVMATLHEFFRHRQPRRGKGGAA